MTALQVWIVIGVLVVIVLGIVGIGAEIEGLPWLWRAYNPYHAGHLVRLR